MKTEERADFIKEEKAYLKEFSAWFGARMHSGEFVITNEAGPQTKQDVGGLCRRWSMDRSAEAPPR